MGVIFITGLYKVSLRCSESDCNLSNDWRLGNMWVLLGKAFWKWLAEVLSVPEVVERHNVIAQQLY